MTEATFENAVDEILGRLDPIVLMIEQGGADAALYSLQLQLIELMALIERNPGIEAATGDLYAAAEALVVDRTACLQPMARKLRLLVEAHQRFRNQLSAARPLKPGHKGIWLHGNLRFAA
ncbi:MAG: hypothetical protein ABW003_13635 [Microvirga sp.]